MAHDIAGLEKKIRLLNETIFKLHSAKHTEALVPIVHNPGWTTLPEFELVQFQIDTITSQISSVEKSLDALVAIAGKIGKS